MSEIIVDSFAGVTGNMSLNSRGLRSIDPDRLDATMLRSILHYDPLTGDFIWKIQRGGTARPGSKAGSPDKDGYLLIRIGNRNFKAHRLAVLYMTGEWPTGDIDHAEGASADNRWEKIRDLSHSRNLINCRLHAHNTSGENGVGWHEQKKKWRAYIQIAGRFVHLGYFTDRADAIVARREAAETYVGGKVRSFTTATEKRL